MLDRESGRSRGFGFVTFDSENAVEKVLSNGRMHEIHGKQVSYADSVLIMIVCLSLVLM